MKTGVTTSVIIHANDKKRKEIQIKKSNARSKRAKICVDCESNEEGFCKKHNAWCGRVNYICLGIKNPYEYKIPKGNSKKGISKKKHQKLKKKKKFNKGARNST